MGVEIAATRKNRKKSGLIVQTCSGWNLHSSDGLAGSLNIVTRPSWNLHLLEISFLVDCCVLLLSPFGLKDLSLFSHEKRTRRDLNSLQYCISLFLKWDFHTLL
jgi:hypothetical protein